MTVRRIALAGALLGLLAGIAVALAVPRTRAQSAHPFGTPPIDPGSDTVTRVGAPMPSTTDHHLRATSTPRVEATARDPLGGPDWAVRTFTADRLSLPAQRRKGIPAVTGHELCVQLGRVHDGAFGWLMADGTFRPIGPDADPGPFAGGCGSATPDLRGYPDFSVLAPITDPHAPRARIKATIAWGMAGTAGRAVTLTTPRGTLTPALSADHRAFVVALPGDADQQRIDARFTYNDGAVHRAPHRSGLQPGGPEIPADARTIIAARAPDPNGGLPYAEVALRGAHGWCQALGGRLVGTRAGDVDFARDAFSQAFGPGAGECASAAERAGMFARRPVRIARSPGNGRPDDDADDAGRVARRTQPGLTTFDGTVAPGVTAVTLTTPRDVRTLIPTGPLHAILAVYDGTFPSGVVRVTARFRDGHTRTETLPDPGP
jgi:hypothetical protein